MSLPADDALHPLSQSETWYYNAHLFTESGERFGIQLVFWGYPPSRPGFSQTSTTFAVTDHRGDTPVFTSKRSSAPLSYDVAPTDFAIEVSDGDYHNYAAGYDGDAHIGASLDGYAVELSLVALKAPALHGDGGRVRLPLGYDEYYSRTRLSAEGTLTFGDRVETVTGMAWSEHQYGVSPTVSWEWFSIQLDDGRDLMIYARATPGTWSKTIDFTLVEADCGQRTFRDSDVRVTRLGSWTSPDTGIEYGNSWQIELPQEELSLTVTPRLAGSELLPLTFADIPYVYADCDVSGIQRGRPLSGFGFLEQAVLAY